MIFVGTSAKNGDGIDTVFDKIIDRIDGEQIDFFEQRTRKETISLNSKPKGGKKGKKKKGGCC